MIDTLFDQGILDSSKAFLLSFVIGALFGFVLERAGFGSSRRLAGIFYFRDMTVLKVMFTAVVTAMLGLAFLMKSGVVTSDQIFNMPTIYGAQIVGGLLFGLGFVMGGWCPGTAAVGVASGKIDAFVFLIGAMLGSILFNEFFVFMKKLYIAGDQGVQFVYENLRISKGLFMLLFTTVAVGCFWFAEWVERKVAGTGVYLGSRFLRIFSLALIGMALFYYLAGGFIKPAACPLSPEKELLATIEAAGDHIEPEELAQRIYSGEGELLVVDIRDEREYAQFHIRKAKNIALKDLPEALQPFKDRGMIVLYSGGMTHAVQARDSLARLGFQNVYILTDGIAGFVDRCLKPLSLRPEPVDGSSALRIQSWRAFFLSPEPVLEGATASFSMPSSSIPGLVQPDWLNKQLGKAGFVMVDLRPQPEYNSGHIPGAIALNIESMRGVVNGLPSMLLPADMLARHFSAMGISPDDFVVLIYGDKPQDATLIAMALNRLGHKNYAIVDGGFFRWIKGSFPTNTHLPKIVPADYPVQFRDDFTVDAVAVLEAIKGKDTVILDVRPEDFYSGKKSDEARAGHIPGAVNRPYTEDILKEGDVPSLRSFKELEQAYAALIPDKNSRVIVHCRTGHQASQTYFVLKYLLGYKNVFWYDAGWTEWAARSDFPIE